MAKRKLGPGTMMSPLPVVMVTCGDMKKSNIITIAWTGIVNSEPPMTYISVRKSRYSHDIIEKNGEFVINLVNEKTAEAADFCGVRSGKDMDKFQVTGLTPIKADIVAAPLIAESPVNLECRVVEKHEYPSHDMFVAKIVEVHADEELFDDKNRLCLDKASMVSFTHGEYIGLKKQVIGGFGFSVMKPKTKKKKNREKARNISTLKKKSGADRQPRKK